VGFADVAAAVVLDEVMVAHFDSFFFLVAGLRGGRVGGDDVVRV
jgi:hypothetical protein